VEIERLVWTEHAQTRLRERRLDAGEIEEAIKSVEEAIKSGHADREVNDGRAEWLIGGATADGTTFEAIYDHPHGEDEAAVRIVSVWRLDS
jgi:hypothetical protein